MPIFHTKLLHQGTPQAPPTPELLQATGPVGQVQLEVPAALAQRLVAASTPIPAPVVGLALIDTGATVSCVDSSVPPRLTVNPVGRTTLSGATGRGASALYPMRLVIRGVGLTVDYSHLVGAELSPMGYVALLGRDFLSRTLLVYHGPVGEYTLST